MQVHDYKIEGVPQFVSYFSPVIEAMKELGGRAKPPEVFAAIAKKHHIPSDFVNETNDRGQSKFGNKVSWARFYLTKTGYMYSPKRGTWALTDIGQETTIDEEQAVTIFQNARAKFRANADEESAPDEEVVPDGTNYWFVGGVWGQIDQTERFLSNGVWQNGYDEKFSDLVRKMKQGDRIALKSTFTRKNDLPFDNNGHTVSTMRIKAIGTVTKNHGDGRTIDVDWEELDPPRDWFFYTYRTTVSRARSEDDDMARQLIAFTFDEAEQDYRRFLAHPYWADKFANRVEPLTALEEEERSADDTDEITIDPYGIEDIIDEGGFTSETALMTMLARLSEKKNLILQGPPGTGKTWLAKRLAKALLGRKTPRPEQLRSVQFHPSLSYEDFVRGYRPGPSGLAITDGIFLQAIEAARAQPDVPFVLIIEEINRGNPAQVFGEMLTLLENTKRQRADAIELAYRKSPGERVHIPENFHVIGTMNIADRSLALVDFALRRRFSFISLEPTLNKAWEAWCSKLGLNDEAINSVRERMNALNDEIAADRSLGPQFRIGHSYVTPNEPLVDHRQWFREVIETEIGPLLEEYWFDAPDRANQAIGKMLAGL